MPEDKRAFPTDAELTQAKQVAVLQLVSLFREGRLSLGRIPLSFEHLRHVVNDASNPTEFLRDMVRLAVAEVCDSPASTNGVSDTSWQQMDKFLIRLPKTGKMDPVDRSLVLLAYREVADGATLVRPKIEGFLENCTDWSDAELETSKRLRLLMEQDPDVPPPSLGGGRGG